MSKLTDGLKKSAAAKRARKVKEASAPAVPYQTHVHSYLESLHLNTPETLNLAGLQEELREFNAKLDAKQATLGTVPEVDMTPPPKFDLTIKQPWMESTPEKQCKLCKKFLEFRFFNKSDAYEDGFMILCMDCEPKYESSGVHIKEVDDVLNPPGKSKRVRRKKFGQEHRRVYRMLIAAHSRAMRQGIPYDLDAHTFELEERLKRGVCEMTGMKWDFETPYAFNVPALYPVDVALGMVYSNIRIICWGMNVALGTWGPEVLKSAVLDWMAKEDVQ